MTETTDYLLVGSSHAALEALAALRMHDARGHVTMVTRERHLPYSPTLLPYLVSGRVAPQRAWLRDAADLDAQGVDYRTGMALVALDTEGSIAHFADGSALVYRKLLLATGAAPVLPPIAGIDSVPRHVLRTVDDALRLAAAIAGARSAVVLGGGLVGMHAAENLVAAGLQVSVVEMNASVLAGYLDARAAAFVERAFAAHGAHILTGRRVVELAPHGSGAHVVLDDGGTLDADLLLVAAGVRPDLDYLRGSGVEVDAGVIVDDTMRSSVANVWAAGDCAQARDFYSTAKILNAIVPDAAEQGRIAGMAMAGDPQGRVYAGGVPLNTYRFFGRHAVSVGRCTPNGSGALDELRVDEGASRYLRAVFDDGRLQGIAGIGEAFDGGVMRQLIMRRVDVSGDVDRMLADPRATGRELMSRLWR